MKITLDEYRNGLACLFVRRGSEHPCAKLTPDLVKAIRVNRHGKSDSVWAAELGVSRESVRDARQGRTWSHVR
jgi:hypothetical protein